MTTNFDYPYSSSGMTANQLWYAARSGLLSLVSLDYRTGSFPAAPQPWQWCARPDLGLLYQYNATSTSWIAMLPLGAPAASLSIPVYSGDLTASTDKFVPPRNQVMRIDALTIVPDDATTSDGSNNWTFQLTNRSQADAILFATAKTTNGDDFAANTIKRWATDQNQTLVADDVIELTVTKTGSPGDVAPALICVEAVLIGG